MRRVGVLLAAAALLTGCGGAHPRISVDRPVALVSQPLRVAVSGLKPHARVVVHASTTDRSGKPFVAQTDAVASADGRVELRGDRAMRLIWSLHPPHVPAWQYYAFDSAPDGFAVTLRVGQAETTAIRKLRAPGVRLTKLRPEKSGFYGDFFAPPARFRGRTAAILDFGGSEGGLSTTFGAGLFASQGYPTLALAYFAAPGLPKNLVRIPLEYFAKALRWLAAQPDVDPRKIVVLGTSRGSEAAQLLGIHYPRLVHAVVALVPSDGAVCGIKRIFGGASYRCDGPAWTFRGRPIPYSSLGSVLNPHPFPDERIDGPIFLLCGGEDGEWPSCPMSAKIVSRLRAHHFAHTVIRLAYPAAGHSVADVPYYPGPDLPQLAGATTWTNQIARARFYPRLLSFLRAFADGGYS